ncbi:MAG: hypothetical protein P4L33_18875 [Capsulimonadaceae bacterium]|nr:hypothetical protein [Capsulimonadaceae bacterium]
MGSAYTPGLTITPRATIRRTRRLPLKGDVLVKAGQPVTPADTVARASLPGIMQSVKVAAQLGVEPDELAAALKVGVGDEVAKDQILAETKSFFGFFKSEAKSPVSGTVETISNATGSVGIRQASTPVDLSAYISGTIVEIIEAEGVVVETEGALIQGIFGVGGERTGVVQMVSASPDDVLDAAGILPEHAGKLLVAGAGVTGSALRRASDVGVAGIVTGGIVDQDLIAFLGYDIGVAITGHENINITVVVTEGFGRIPMARRTFELLSSLGGQTGSINGATQIRAGVIRPEVIVPHASTNVANRSADDFELSIGSSIRVIREPYFGALGTVVKLPPELAVIESGAVVRVLDAELLDGRKVTVPRANVEIVAG